MSDFKKKFNLTGKIVFITGASGLLGKKHCEAIAEIGGIPILFDKKIKTAKEIAKDIRLKYNLNSMAIKGDVTKFPSVLTGVKTVLKKYKKIDVLINNASNNPQVKKKQINSFTLENLNINQWHQDIYVGLSGAFICTQIIGKSMIKNKKGVIINISSDLGIIAPDQRIYKLDNSNKNYVKPASYSVVKHGIIGLTKYVSTYWADKGIRCNALCPGGVFNNQPTKFVNNLKKLIPLNRMANSDEYKSAIQFLSSDASSYMNGSSLIIDGGRTTW